MNKRPLSEAEPPLNFGGATIRPWHWLAIGLFVTALAGMRFNVGIIGWVAAVPWLLYLRQTTDWRRRLSFFAVLQVAVFVAILKIMTDPVPWYVAAMFSVPMAAGQAVLYLTFEGLRRRAGDAWGLLLFPAIMVIGEWLAASFSEGGSWGSLAYTQLGNTPLMQVTSLFGLAGVTTLLAMTSALVAVALSQPREGWWRRPAVALAVLVFVAHAWGSFRLFKSLPGRLVDVATVVSDVKVKPRKVPPQGELERATNALFVRSEVAARRGAEVIVWNEGATAVRMDEETDLLQRGHVLAARFGVDIIMAYVVPIDGMKRYENKLVWMTPDGPIQTYFKHHPVPSEGSMRGSEPLVVHDRPYGRAAAAICYDYDFPAHARRHARMHADIVFVPSSDWTGIDPYHAQMAAVRGIEGGFSVVRPARYATSGAFDAHGVARGLASEREGERIMIASVPAEQIPTLYTAIGDALVGVAGAILALGGLAAFRRRR